MILYESFQFGYKVRKKAECSEKFWFTDGNRTQNPLIIG